MPDICLNLSIRSAPDRVFEAMTSAKGLNSWWTLDAAGHPRTGELYRLYFGPEYEWYARVTECTPEVSITWTVTEADADWHGTRVSFCLEGQRDETLVRFCHEGWATRNDHFRRSAFCWAMYLRLLKRFVELGETVAYKERQNY